MFKGFGWRADEQAPEGLKVLVILSHIVRPPPDISTLYKS
jgi:hypothetical protein